MGETSPQVSDGLAARPAEVHLRLWPAIVIVVLLWPAIKLPLRLELNPIVSFQMMFLGPVVAAVLVALWWLFFSRAPWRDRWLGLGAFAAAAGAAYLLIHPSFVFSMVMYALPAVTTAWVLWMAASVLFPWRVRRAGLIVVLVLGWGYYTTLRFDGVTGGFSGETSYRWTLTAEQKHLASLAARKLASEAVRAAAASSSLALQPGDWPCFRGPNRDSRLIGVRIATDWQTRPPRQLWKQRVGPGWSSFAVIGPRLYTQEQRDKDELVVCYETETGAEIWAHADPARFTEPVGGPGPRATPTFHEGKLYTLGARGNLNCLEAGSGKVIWTRNIVSDSGRDQLPEEGIRPRVPLWGFAASPLIAHGIVTVFAGGPGGKSVLGYQAASGELAWAAGEGEMSYCSPQLSRLGGVEQILITTGTGMTAFDPVKGNVLWQHTWAPMEELARIVQPAVLSDSEVLLGTGMVGGTRCVRVSQGKEGWSAAEHWTSSGFRPYFNDFVVHGGHLYGFDNTFFACVSAQDGKRKWRERGYGNGQVLALAEQNLLLVLTETGEVALVETNPDQHKEVARFKAIDGKTWNHPVIAHGKLFVRNGEEMACFDVSEPGTK